MLLSTNTSHTPTPDLFISVQMCMCVCVCFRVCEQSRIAQSHDEEEDEEHIKQCKEKKEDVPIAVKEAGCMTVR